MITIDYNIMSSRELFSLAFDGHYHCVDGGPSYDEWRKAIESALRKVVIREASVETCEWKEDRYDAWDTECGNCFTFLEGGPKENDSRYCCYCGKLIKAVPYVEYVDPRRPHEGRPVRRDR